MKLSLSPRSALVLIAALFILPLLAAWMMYAGIIEFKPANTRNLGQLVEPPVPLDWSRVQLLNETGQDARDTFAEHWVVLHPVALPCTEKCMATLVDLRQVHKASGRHQDRIRLAILLNGGDDALRADVQEIYPRFVIITDPRSELVQALQQAGAGGSNYLIDPLGNIMMRYEAGADPNHLKQDLKRLLTWSKLDENT